MRWTKRWAKRLRAVARKDAVERELDEELAFHLEMEIQKNLRAGMGPAEARRQAALAFGGVERFKEEVRDARMLGWTTGLSLDLKLGWRMLARYPGLALVGGLAIAFAIGVGAATFELVKQVTHPRLPLPGGDRVVGVRNWDLADRWTADRVLHDFGAWREQLRTVEEVGAFRTTARNLAVGGGAAVPVPVAEISASGFRVARVAPRLGRALVEADEAPGAPPVAVLGHEVWRARFGGDPGVVGRTVRLDGEEATVVGVMPEGFAFPVSHDLWVPFRLRPLDYRPGEGPEIQVFGRLAPGATLAEARAEAAALGRRASADFPETHRHLRAEVLPLAQALSPVPVDWTVRAGMYSINVAVLMFLLLVCANVAALLFARTATRESEIVVRSALGASRGRIVVQLFAEALVLGGAAAVVGLTAAALGLGWGMGTLEAVTGDLPFWFRPGLSAPTVVYTVLLTLLGAGVAGVAPALKVTRGLQERLRQAAVGSPGLRFGRLWTGVIMTQVAFTAAFLPIALSAWADVDGARSVVADFPAEAFLSARLRLSREVAPGSDTTEAAYVARAQGVAAGLERRLAAAPEVAAVTFADLLPRMDHPLHLVEVEGETPLPDSARGHRVARARVEADYFEVLGAPPVSGRGFQPGDAASGQAVVVNRSFVAGVLGGRNPVGLRVRYLSPGRGDDTDEAAEPGPWLEIVGVVPDLGMTAGDRGEGAGIYHAVAPGAVVPLFVAVRARGEPSALEPRLRDAAASADPALRVHDVLPLDQIQRDLMRTYGFWLRIGMLASAVVLLLSMAGIYAVMSFTVARRTREIGIRVALGADRRRVVAPIFRRALTQVGLGMAAGTLLVLALTGGMITPRIAVLLASGVTLTLGAGALACVVPTRRALRVEPTEALRAEI